MATHSTHVEHRRTIERELLAFGIKPNFERTNGGHMRVVFEAGGKTHAELTSWTPSDHRSTLNARARIRRTLREAGVVASPAPVPLLQKALSLPIIADPLPARVERLENDIAVLLDILAELVPVAPTVVEPEPEPEPVEPEPEPAPRAEPEVKAGGKHAKMNALLECMSYTWTDVGVIVSRDGRSRDCVSQALSYLKKKGVVESGQRGQWRKVRQPQPVEPVVAPVVEAEPVIAQPVPRAQKTRGHPPAFRQQSLLLCVEYQWTATREIIRRAGLKSVNVSVALNELKKKGLVENGERGFWRKVRQQTNGHAH